MNDRELLKQAYDALGLINHRGNNDEELQKVGLTRVLLEARLEESEPEPVAWLIAGAITQDRPLAECQLNTPLYLHPTKPTGLDQLLERIRFLEQQIAEKNK